MSRVQEVGINNESQRDSGKKKTESLTWLKCSTKEATLKQLMNEKIMASTDVTMHNNEIYQIKKSLQNLSETQTNKVARALCIF